MAPRSSSLATHRQSHSRSADQPGGPPGFPAGGVGLSPAALGFTYDWRKNTGIVTDAGGLVSWTDSVSSAPLLADPGFRPTVDPVTGVLTFNGIDQYAYCTTAGLLALSDGDDESWTIAMRAAITGLQPQGRAVGWSLNTAGRHHGLGLKTSYDGYRLSRGSTTAEGGTLDASDRAWIIESGGTGAGSSKLVNGSGDVLAVDLSAAGAATVTHFVLGGRIATSGLYQQFLEMSVASVAVKAGKLTTGEKASLLAYLDSI